MEGSMSRESQGSIRTVLYALAALASIGTHAQTALIGQNVAV